MNSMTDIIRKLSEMMKPTIYIYIIHLYAPVLSKMIPVKAEPTKPEQSIIRPIMASWGGSMPYGLNVLLITFPRLKKRPMKEEKAIVRRVKLLFLQSALIPSPRFKCSMGAKATAEGGCSGRSLKTS